MILNRHYLILICGGIFLAVFLGGYESLHTEWRVNYTIIDQRISSNIIKYYWNKTFENALRFIFSSNEKGLKSVRLYVPVKAQRNLMKDIPGSVKKWQRGFMTYPNNELHRIKVRYRGDNPLNWAFEKKSWRIKARKTQLINRTRSLNYIVPKKSNYINYYLGYYIAKQVGLIAPQSEMVELFLNDKSYGPYTEIEQLDESFLRKIGKMPVNIYKGEQKHGELQLMIENDLFNNPFLWSKTSFFNQVERKNYSDLSYFIDLIQKAETSEESLKELKQVASYKDWALFSAYLTLVQSSANDSYHNQRLIGDAWLGRFEPIAYESSVYYSHFGENKINPYFEGNILHALWGVYYKSSDFQIRKYTILYKLLNGRIITNTIKHIENNVLPLLRQSRLRDRYFHQLVQANHQNEKMIFMDGMEKAWDDLINGMKYTEKFLLENLQKKPELSWESDANKFEIVINGVIPVEKISLNLAKDSELPKMIVWDRDGNRMISKKDLLIPHNIEKHKLTLNAQWVANRIIQNIPELRGDIFQPGITYVSPAKFRLISDVNITIDSVTAENALTHKVFDFQRNRVNEGNTPTLFNVPVIEDQTTPQIWSGQLIIDGTHIVSDPVVVEAGTTIRMKAGSSIIFKNQINMKGSANKPINIVSDSSNYWGTIALHGRKTAGSLISNVNIENGSGVVFPHVRYIGMLSIHDTENVTLNNIRIRRNNVFDDMVHIIYCKKITVNNLVLEGAKSDGLDVDLSTIKINGARIIESGNDAIDLMTSQALIQNVQLLNSGDKGISVGEDSEVLVYNSKLVGNNIGIQSKDSSMVYFVNSDLINNKIHANAAMKNWRYGGGGGIHFDKVFIEGSGKITTDKISYINIYDSSLFPRPNILDPKVKIDDISTFDKTRNTLNPYFRKETNKILEKWKIIGKTNSRGVSIELLH